MQVRPEWILETDTLKMLIQCYICFSIAESSGSEDCLDRQAASFAELISQRCSIWHFFVIATEDAEWKAPSKGLQFSAKECWHERED